MTPEERREASAKEYSQYVATEAIDIGTARAFNVGDPVPASHVLVQTGHPAVARVSTKAAQAAVDTSKEG